MTFPTAAEMAAVASAYAGTTIDDFGAVVLGGVPVPVAGANFVDLARFETKITFGDFTKDSDAVQSTWVRSSWTGGALIDDHQEGVTDTRFSFSHLHTRSPNQLSLNFQTYTAATNAAAGETDKVYPIGDYDNAYYTVIGLKLYRQAAGVNTADDTTLIGTLAGAPTERGTVYNDILYIPMGANGLATYNGTTLATDATTNTPDPVSLTIWDHKLFALDIDGHLRRWDGTAWDTPSNDLLLPSDRTPRKLVWFYDRSGEPTIFMATNRDLWGWDAAANVIHPGRMQLPSHPDNGLACVGWRDDALYYASGMNVFRITASGSIAAVGLDRDDGLPIDFHGRIVDLVPELNGLIALIEGVQSTPPVASDTFVMEQGPFGDDFTFATGNTTALSLIMMWNEAGWHTLWRSTEPITPTWLALSEVDLPDVGAPAATTLDYGLHFPYTNGTVGPEDRFMPFPKYFFGPKKLVQQNSFPFAASGQHWEGRFDAGMQGFQKLASHFEVNIENPLNGIPFEGSVAVWYQTDRSMGWTKLGEAVAYGRTVLPFGVDATGFPAGEAFGWIAFRYDVARGATVTQTPVIDSLVFKFLKLPLPGTSWTMAVPLRWTDDWMGQTAESIRDHLRSLTTSESFTPLQLTVNGPTFRVRVAQGQGTQPIGADPRGDMTLSVLEVSIPGWEAA